MDIEDPGDMLHSMSDYFSDHQELAGSFHRSFGRTEGGGESLVLFLSSAGCIMCVEVLCDLRLYCELIVGMQYEGGVITV